MFLTQISKIALHNNCKFVGASCPHKNFPFSLATLTDAKVCQMERYLNRIPYFELSFVVDEINFALLRFLLLAWSSTFLLCILIHCVYIGCDLVTGKYIAESNRDPR